LLSEKAQNSRVCSGFIASGLDIATRGHWYLRRLLVASKIARLVDSVFRSCSTLKIVEAPWRCSALLVSDAVTWRLLITSWTRKGISRIGLWKRHHSQTRVNRCCALQDYSFRHTIALLCPGWSHWGTTQFALTVQVTQGGCLALHFASTPSVNERSTLASPFCFFS